ncbi:hypothetical protein AAHE18_04G044900 [Arachis hypogaea]
MSSSSSSSSSVGRSFVLWLHGLGDSGPANEPIKNLFTSPQFRNTKWLFPSAPNGPVTCNYGHVMPSWFDIHEIPITADSPQDESGLLKAVKNVHATIDKEIADGTNPNNVFICGFSQGGALTLASVLLYPKTLGGGAVFSGWVPFNSSSSIIGQITPEAKRVQIFKNFIILITCLIHHYYGPMGLLIEQSCLRLDKQVPLSLKKLVLAVNLRLILVLLTQ